MTALEALKAQIVEGRRGEAWDTLLQLARGAADYATVQALCRARRKLLGLGPAPQRPLQLRLAVLGGATTTMLHEPLELLLQAAGVDATLHASTYGTFAAEMIDPASATVAFRPDVAVVVTTPANLPSWPAWNASTGAADAVADEVGEYWLGLCRSLHEHARCDVVLGNFHSLPVRPYGTAGVKLAGEPNRFLRAVNEHLARRAPPFVHLMDVAALAAFHGVDRWFDARYWYHAKQPVSFECLVPYVREIAQLVAALFGRSAKCVVVDLDNTLWGGVVGDDGADALLLGEGDPQGEAFTAFQRYLRRLKDRGLLLAVASKNDEAQALAPFARRPEMVLRRDDFAAFVADWRPKSRQLKEIATTLNLGLDALVFVDDNPAEREQVRQALPEVRVVDLGDDPAGYPAAVDRSGWLDQVAVSAEDAARTALYEADTVRAVIRSSLGDYDAYLRSLEQRAIVAPFEERHLDRITQLTNKTNQFNLTTRRLTRSDLAVMRASPAYITASVCLADRFGDNGLISVLAARGAGPDLWIDLWLMSCRVLKRGVERLVCNYLMDRAKAAGYRTVHGVYLPTERNGMVKDLYAELGFTPCGPMDGGDHWSVPVDAYRPVATTITVVEALAP